MCADVAPSQIVASTTGTRKMEAVCVCVCVETDVPDLKKKACEPCAQKFRLGEPSTFTFLNRL